MTRWLVLVLLFFATAIGCNVLTLFAPAVTEQAQDSGTLDITIAYTGDFYTEVFGYAPDAENVRHYVMVLPERESDRLDGRIPFFSLAPQQDGTTTIREDRQEDAWVLDYIYDAPDASFSGTFAPGTYVVGTAFIVAPLPREEAGVDDDVVLWPGVTGGGANTDFDSVEIVAGETITLDVTITDADGWACPWLYVFDGTGYVRYSEILRNLRGAANARTELTPLVGYAVVDGAIHLRIVEEKDEISYIDMLYLLVDGEAVYADDPRLNATDGDNVILHEGDSIDLRFPVDPPEGATVQVMAYGYYEVD